MNEIHDNKHKMISMTIISSNMQKVNTFNFQNILFFMVLMLCFILKVLYYFYSEHILLCFMADFLISYSFHIAFQFLIYFYI